jgi:hypothetical protein
MYIYIYFCTSPWQSWIYTDHTHHTYVCISIFTLGVRLTVVTTLAVEISLTWIKTCTHVCICEYYTYIYMCVCVYIYIYILCTNTQTHKHTYIIYTCIYIYTYKYIYLQATMGQNISRWKSFRSFVFFISILMTNDILYIHACIHV